MSDPKGYYKFLGVPIDAPTEQIREAYNKMVRKYFPGHGSEYKKAKLITDEEKRAKRLEECSKALEKANEAKENLLDEKKREIYDNGGMERDFSSGFTATNIFEFFTGLGRKRGSKMQSTHYKINTSLKDVYVGKTCQYKVKRNLLCEQCKGTGHENSNKCGECKGRGAVIRQMHQFGGLAAETKCMACDGVGFITSGSECKKCDKGYLGESKIFKVEIKPGAKHGDIIKFEGMGDQALGTKPGDVIFEVCVEDNPNFRRVGDHLVSFIDIPLYTILAGGSVFFRHLDERNLEINISGANNLNDCIIVKGEGFGLRNKGDLILEPAVKIPSKFDKKLLKKALNFTEECNVKANKSVKGTFGEMPEETVEEEHDMRGFPGSFFFNL